MRTALIRSAKLALVSIIFSAGSVLAQAPGVCSSLPSHAELRAALRAAKAASNGGFATEMWGTIVNRSGIICAIVYTGNEVADQWPGSRLISAAKANKIVIRLGIEDAFVEHGTQQELYEICGFDTVSIAARIRDAVAAQRGLKPRAVANI